MADNAQPSKNPADDGSLTGAFRSILGKFLQNTDDMLPAKVIAVSADRTRVTVQPIIKVVSTSGQQISRAQIASVPIMQLGAGGFLLSFPIKPNDLGWIKASDRDISLFLQSFTDSPPNTARKHTFEDGVFIPSVMTGYTINSEDAANAVLQSLDGSIRISLFPDKIKITSPLVEIDGELVVTGNVTGNSISLDTHVHSGVQPGGGDTGGPV